MIKRVFRRAIRQPLPCIGAILFVAILAVILCFLHRSQKEEQQALVNTYYATPIRFDITWLDGTRLNNSAPASGHMADILPELFLGTCRHEPHFDDLVTDLQIRMSNHGSWVKVPEGEETEEETVLESVVGITSPKAANNPSSNFGDSIEWREGYDESVFGTNEFVCVVPADFDGPEELRLTFSYKSDFTCTLRVVGKYPAGNTYIYCPYGVMEHIYLRINEPKVVELLSGQLKNNDDLEIFRERAKEWFATPNATGEPTPWGKWVYEYYPLAIDIDDSLLSNLEEELHKSIQINRIASTLVFILSAGAGFLTGFLVIRSRKQEIALMRTLGTSNGVVCLELALEQLLCVAVGVLLGGSYALWAPIANLCIFAGVYIAGLTVALLIFTRTNLLATMKEDE